MRVVTITEAKNGLSSLIDVVQDGETVLILDRGRPVARLESAIGGSGDDAGGRLARLQRAGTVRVAAGVSSRPKSGKPVRPKGGASAAKVLMDERRAGR
ncbi:MAG TPA: type II toxin-antitoxin system Phd/YefM family antitoxin [Acidimicrobiales bacterium]|nr:type II toxin-antitoxin system Phd/YefM family antitoxin [Acidimicrobiales bacterium]